MVVQSSRQVRDTTTTVVPAVYSGPESHADERLLGFAGDAFAILPAKLQWRLAAYYRAVGAHDLAADVLDAVERRSGESMQLLEERARLAFAMGRWDEA